MKRLFLGVFFFCCACGAIYASRHRIVPGDTLYSIAKANGTTVEELQAINGLEPGDVLHPGDILFVPAPGTAPAPTPPRGEVPNAERRERTEPPARPPPRKEATAAVERDVPLQPAAPKSRPTALPTRNRFLWPVAGSVVRPFAAEGRGVDLRTSPGEPVRASAAGKVSYAGTPAPAYGSMVILDHEGDFYTVYSNLGGTGVRSGQLLAADEVLGQAKDYLHFEVRRGRTAEDPLLFLPPR